MHFCKETRKPLGLKEIKSLIIDRKESGANNYYVWPTICLSLDKTLFYCIKSLEASNLDDNVLKSAIEVSYIENGIEEKCFVLERPGATELLMELKKYSSTMIYSCESDEFIEAAMLALSIAQGDPHEDDCIYEADAYMDLYVWSKKQCIPTSEGLKKSLGILSRLSDDGIDDHWLIDHSPDLVDYPSHVIAVSEFLGDPKDRELYRLMEQIFVN